MSIGRNEVLHVAKLAELAVADEELPRLVQQMARIVDYVAQLESAPSQAAADEASAFVAGPPRVSLREDVEGSTPLARSPAEMAPQFAGGFYVVPRLGAMEES